MRENIAKITISDQQMQLNINNQKTSQNEKAKFNPLLYILKLKIN